MRRATRLCAVALGAAAVTGLSSCGVARNVLYSPRTGPVAISQWTNEAPAPLSVTTSDGLALTGYYWPGASDDPDIFVFFHGRHAHQGIGAKYAQYLRGRGDGVLVASYRGFGDNPGRPSKDGMIHDAAAFVAKARALAGPDARLWLVGHSLGAAVALQAARGEPNIGGVITIGAFARIQDATPPLLRGLLPDQWDNRDAVRNADEPLILLHGSADRVVPPGSAGALARLSPRHATAIMMGDSAHKPNMQKIGPWISAAIETVAAAGKGTLPPLPDGWVMAEQKP